MTRFELLLSARLALGIEGSWVSYMTGISGSAKQNQYYYLLHGLWNPGVQCRILKGSPIILSRINPIPRTDAYFFKINFNIVLPIRIISRKMESIVSPLRCCHSVHKLIQPLMEYMPFIILVLYVAGTHSNSVRK